VRPLLVVVLRVLGPALTQGPAELYGSFVNTPQGLQNVPSAEYWPSRGAPFNLSFLEETMPVNLYPLTWLMSDGRLFMQVRHLLLGFVVAGTLRVVVVVQNSSTSPSSALADSPRSLARRPAGRRRCSTTRTTSRRACPT